VLHFCFILCSSCNAADISSGSGGLHHLHRQARNLLPGCELIAWFTHAEVAHPDTGDTAAAAAERNYFRYQAALQREAEPELTIQLPAAASAAPPEATAAVPADAVAGSSAPGGGAGAQLLPGVSFWRASVIC